MMESPLLSVILCCYNAEEHLSKAINSILDQSFTDFEFIIWNDGSTDKTETIIKSFKDERIRYYFHENLGLGASLRLACTYARGRYIARMDADDISVKTRFEEEIKYLNTHKNVVLVSSAVKYINDDDIEIGRSFPVTTSRAIKKKFAKGNSAVVHPACMFRPEAYIAAGGYQELRRSQDMVLFSRMLKYGDFHNISTPLLHYRVSNNSITSLTEASDYSDIIRLYKRKLVSDSLIDEKDVYIYNLLVEQSRKKKATNSYVPKSSGSKIEILLYRILKLFLGERCAEIIICSLKNLTS